MILIPVLIQLYERSLLVCLRLQVNLDASHNELQDLPFGAPNFWQLSMEHLYLAHNKIDAISTNITELTRLNVLNLSHNKIASLPATSSWTCDRLTRLDLSHNALTVISHRAMVDQHFPKQTSDSHSRKGGGGGGGILRLFTSKSELRTTRLTTVQHCLH